MTTSGIVRLTGDFTVLKYIAKLNAAELERTIGFEKGRLKSGFRIVVLAEDEILTQNDFQLKASSRWSAGILHSRHGNTINEILLNRGQDVEALKHKVANFFSSKPENRPAKVLPNLVHTQGMKYPNAEALGPGIPSGVPQFHLINPKNFHIFKQVA